MSCQCYCDAWGDTFSWRRVTWAWKRLVFYEIKEMLMLPSKRPYGQKTYRADVVIPSSLMDLENAWLPLRQKTVRDLSQYLHGVLKSFAQQHYRQKHWKPPCWRDYSIFPRCVHHIIMTIPFLHHRHPLPRHAFIGVTGTLLCPFENGCQYKRVFKKCKEMK